MSLRIGKISFTNLFPLFYTMERMPDCAGYEFINGVPSEVNKLLREGSIDISPSSSIEYLRHEDLYTLLKGHSISSSGTIGSILLFSKRPIETLEGLTILTSSQSETSVALLHIILKKFYDLRFTLLSTGTYLSKAMESYSAYLLIGDDALREALRWPRLYIYDLGDIWYKNTGLPFVFALWMARNDFCERDPQSFEGFRKNLDAAKVRALKSLKEIAVKCSLATILSRDEIVSYWKGISYDLKDEHERGLALFQQYAKELGLI